MTTPAADGTDMNVGTPAEPEYNMDEVGLCKKCGTAKHLNAEGYCGRCWPTLPVEDTPAEPSYHITDEDGWCQNDGCMWNVWNAKSMPNCPVKLPKRADTVDEQEELLAELEGRGIPAPAEPKCPTCGGSGLYGYVHGQHMPCPACNGTGTAEQENATVRGVPNPGTSSIPAAEPARWYVNNQEEYNLALKEATKARGGKIYLAPGKYGGSGPLDPSIDLIGAPAESEAQLIDVKITLDAWNVLNKWVGRGDITISEAIVAKHYLAPDVPGELEQQITYMIATYLKGIYHPDEDPLENELRAMKNTKDLKALITAQIQAAEARGREKLLEEQRNPICPQCAEAALGDNHEC